jgi:hypothetical protein
MRFISNGPSLPDDLLTARDAGQVLFFCGAGVSRAEAGLPNFVDLAETVLDLLGSAMESPARRLFNTTRNFERASGQTGLVATDRIFGMLEREFEPAEVREAVAMALKPDAGYALGAHRTLLDLSRNRAGVARLVTTNFDRLFEDCERGIVSTNPPKLPDPSREADFHGVIHLHGCVDADYRRACDDMFVLSSADFGHAYLSDGWATRYIQALLQRFRIVFVGYSADDPPVQYLLEALNRFSRPDHALYAFQAGDKNQAMAQWAHKGVEPIAYDSTNRHEALWKTLSAWAERARDGDRWYDQQIERAMPGPEPLTLHERGIIAHIASTEVGARRLANAQRPLPAEWLFTFDRNARYAKGGNVDSSEGKSVYFDPFYAFGLDCDTPPEPTDPENIYAKRPVPTDAWDGLVVMPADREYLGKNTKAHIRGGSAYAPAQLTPRQAYLGNWIVNIAHQPAALWWASNQAGLHPDIQQQIEWSLRQHADRYVPAVRDGWRMLLASWRQPAIDPDIRVYDIETKAKLSGWGPALVREYVELYQPVLTVRQAGGLKAPLPNAILTMKDLVSVDVDYPRPHTVLKLPDELIKYAVTQFRQTLEHAVQIEREVNGYEGLYLDTTRPDDGSPLLEDGYGLTGHLAALINLMSRLVVIDRDAARSEMARWSGQDDQLFTRLRIWAGGRTDLTSPDEAGQMFLDLSDESFWSSRQERDLLYALRDRWPDMSASIVSKIEERLLKDSFSWTGPLDDKDQLIAHYRLNRLHWFATQGVIFSFDYVTEVAQLRAMSPQWTEIASEHVAQPHVSKAFSIETDISAASIEKLPINQVLDEARSLGARDVFARTQRQPFRGLAKDRPARALSVLTDAARRERFESWAWDALLSSESDSVSSARLLTVVGHRLARLPVKQLVEIAHPVSEWLRKKSEQLLKHSPSIFDLVWDALIAALTANPEVRRFPKPNRSWVDEGLNRPAGRMVDAMFNDPCKANFEEGQGLPEAWKRRLNQLISLPGDHRFQAIAMIAPRLNWLFYFDPTWTGATLVPLASDADSGGKAFWAGFFWGARAPHLPLYLQLKPFFIELAHQPGLRREHANVLSGILLAGWGDKGDDIKPHQLIPDVELREILIHAEEGFRAQVLLHLEHWTIAGAGGWADRLIPFLTKVWPRQRALRTAYMSACLANLALAMPSQFPEIVDAILPRLTMVKGAASLRIKPALDSQECVAIRHPKALLDLLWVILANDPADWPHGSNKLLGQLANQNDTQHDPRLLELRRRLLFQK